jgi:hypothetical protein
MSGFCVFLSTLDELSPDNAIHERPAHKAGRLHFWSPMRVLLMLLLLPAIAGAATVTIIPPTEWDNSTPIPAGTAFQFKLYGAKCGQPLAPLQTFTALEFKRTPVGVGNHCYRLTASAIDSNGVAGPESEKGPEFVITVAPEPVEPPPPEVKRAPMPPTQVVSE